MTTQFTCTGADGTFITYTTADANGRYNVPFTLIPNTAANLNVYLWDATDQEYDLIQQDDADNPWVYDPANNRIDFDGAGPAVGTATLPDGSTQGTLMLARVTDVSEDELAQFTPGSSIRSQDLNDNFNKLGNAIEELHCNATLNGEDFESFYWNKVDVDAGGDTYTSTSTSAWPNNNITIATTAAGDDRWLGIPGGGGTTMTAGDGIAFTGTPATTIEVDLADTTPGLQFTSNDLQVIGNSVVETGDPADNNNPGILNGPSTITITGGDGISATRTSDTNITIAQTTDNNTTYDLSAVAATGNVNLRLTSTNPAGTDDVLVTAGNNITFADITAAGFTINAAGGGGGTGGVQTVANAAGLNALVDLTADPVVEPDDGQVVLVQNSTNLNADAASGDNDEDIDGLPMTVATGGPEGGYSNQIQVTVSWDADDDEWNFIRWVPTNMDNRYVLEAGDTMTGNLLFNDGTANIAINVDGSAVFNEQGDDVDFRVEGSGQANALFVDGSNGRVGINTNEPSQELEVNGDIRVGDNLSAANVTLRSLNGSCRLQTSNTSENWILDLPPAAPPEGTNWALVEEAVPAGAQLTANMAWVSVATAAQLDDRVAVAGDTMTGNLQMDGASVIADNGETIPDDDDDWDIQDSNVWQFAGGTIQFPDTDPIPGQTGIIVLAGAVTTWNEDNGDWHGPDGTPPAGAADTIIPFYVRDANNIWLGAPTTST